MKTVLIVSVIFVGHSKSVRFSRKKDRGNHSPFVIKEMFKAIMTRIQLKKLYIQVTKFE